MNTVVACEDRTSVVRAQIEFLKPTPERPFSYGHDPAAGDPAPTASFELRSVDIHNVRQVRSPLALDRNGATLVTHRSAVADFYDEAQLIETYYPEAAAVIQAATGASKVLVFDHNVRRGQALPLRPGRYAQGRPVAHAHTDYTEASAVRRVHDEYGPSAASLLRHRFMQVNLWRPITGPLRDWPLAICDAGRIGPHDLRAVDLIYPQRRGELYYLAHAPGQRWYYAPDMQPDEAWLLKNFDSATTGAARFAAHSAFEDPAPWGEVPARESIEVRAFAFYDT
jgi:hypothetical protein